MAGIEKVCEFSDEYGSYNMYDWKRNSIQIKPEFRKLFMGSKATLVFSKQVAEEIKLKGNHTSRYIQKEEYYGDKEYYDSRYRCGHKVKEYNYSLVVTEPHLLGQVGGVYTNWSNSKKTVLRRLRRMTRNYKLQIKWID